MRSGRSGSLALEYSFSAGSRAGSEPPPVTTDFSPGETCIIHELRRLTENSLRMEKLLAQLTLSKSRSGFMSDGEVTPPDADGESMQSSMSPMEIPSELASKRRTPVGSARISVQKMDMVPEAREGRGSGRRSAGRRSDGEEVPTISPDPLRAGPGSALVAAEHARPEAPVAQKKSMVTHKVTHKKSRAGGPQVRVMSMKSGAAPPPSVVYEGVGGTQLESSLMNWRAGATRNMEYDMLSQASLCSRKITNKPKDIDGSELYAKKGSVSSVADETGVVAPLLPICWPLVLQSRHEEKIDQYKGSAAGIMACLNSNPHGHKMYQASSFKMRAQVEVQGFGFSPWLMRHVVVNPDSRVRFAYDVISLCVLLYDLSLVPYMLAWDVNFNRTFRQISWFIVVFWTSEMVLNFFTAFYSKGGLVRQPRKIAKNYLRTWFSIDVMIVLCDWVFLTLTAIFVDNSAIGLLRFTKIARLLRIPGMLRAVKFVRVVEDFVERNMTESVRMCMRIVCLFLGIGWLNHVMCCAWFAVGSYAPANEAGYRWIDFDVNFRHAGHFHQYATSFHWSVSQITLGSIEIVCQTTWERIFNVACLFFGLLFGSTLVSSLSATMVEFQMMRKERVQKLRMLRQFLRDNLVDAYVSRAVVHQATERLGEKDKLTEKDVPVLAVLSSSILSELRLEIFRSSLLTHPLFRLWFSVDAAMVKRICSSFCDMIFLKPGDDLFVSGPSRDEVYFFQQGALTYFQDPESAPVSVETEQQVEVAHWLCEASLWVHWLHVGRAEAQISCRLLAIGVGAVEEVMGMHHIAHDVTVQYSKHFHKRLCSAQPPNSAYPTDLAVPFTDYGELVLAMDRELQVAVGLNALEDADESDLGIASKVKAGGLLKLREEVINGKSVVMVNGAGAVERVVSVVALRIGAEPGLRADQRKVLIQVGKYEFGNVDIQASCQLPGAKPERDEMLGDAVKRIVRSRIGPLTSCEVLWTERQVEWKESKEYGVKTKYLRTVCHSRLRAPLAGTLCQRREWSSEKSEGGPRLGATSSRFGALTGRQAKWQPDPDILKMDVYVQKLEGNKYSFFVWATPEDFEHLSSSAGEQDLSALIRSITFDPSNDLEPEEYYLPAATPQQEEPYHSSEARVSVTGACVWT